MQVNKMFHPLIFSVSGIGLLWYAISTQSNLNSLSFEGLHLSKGVVESFECRVRRSNAKITMRVLVETESRLYIVTRIPYRCNTSSAYAVGKEATIYETEYVQGGVWSKRTGVWHLIIDEKEIINFREKYQHEARYIDRGYWVGGFLLFMSIFILVYPRRSKRGR